MCRQPVERGQNRSNVLKLGYEQQHFEPIGGGEIGLANSKIRCMAVIYLIRNKGMDYRFKVLL